MMGRNVKKGLECTVAGYVLVAGSLAIVGPGNELLTDMTVGGLF